MMNVLTAALFWAGIPLLLMATGYAAVVVYRNDSAHSQGERRSIADYVAGAMGAGCLALLLLWFIGIPATCELLYPGRMDCGFWAGLAASPLAFALGTAVFIGCWHWRSQKPQKTSSQNTA